MTKKKVTKKVEPKSKFPFLKDQTLCGASILSVFGPDEHGCYAGVISDSAGLTGVTWDSDGNDVDNDSNLLKEAPTTKVNKIYPKVK